MQIQDIRSLKGILVSMISASVLTLTLSIPLQAEIKNLPLDLERSQISWVGKKITGQHNGTLQLKSGEVLKRDGKIESGEFILNMGTIKNLDIESESYRTRLENHLKSDDFFDVEKFPEGSFQITDITQIDDNNFTIAGNLTLKDITQRISFPAEISNDSGIYSAKAKTTIDRTVWNVQYNSGKFFDAARLGDKLIYDEIEVALSLYTKPQS